MDDFATQGSSASSHATSARSRSRASRTSQATGYTYGTAAASTSRLTYEPPSTAGTAVRTRNSASRATLTARSKSRAASSIPRSASVIGASDGHEIICAVSESRGISPAVGIALIDITTGEAALSQVNDTQFYMRTIQKIEVFEPAKILVPSTFFPPNPESTLLGLLEKSENLPNTTIIPVGRKYWSENSGLDSIQQLAFLEDIESIKLSLEGKYYALCSFAAAMNYLEMESSLRFASHSLRINYQPCEESMMIDLPTIQALELIQNARNSKSKDCLLGLLDSTLTPMGSRSLRSNILQPSAVNNTLEDRYDAVEEFSTKEDMFFAVRKALKEFADLEKDLTKMVIQPKDESTERTEQAINQVLKIKNFLSAVQPFHEAMVSARSDLIVGARDLCRPELTAQLLSMITTVVNDDAVYVSKPIDLRNQRVYAVKSGVHSLLDVARKTYKEATNDLQQYITELNTKLDLAGELMYDQKRRYYLKFRSMDLTEEAPPDELVNCIRVKDYLECQTIELIKYNQHISTSETEVMMQSDAVIRELLQDLSSHSSALFKICESIALVDMLASFAHLVTTKDEYTRPHLGNTMAVTGARHPIMDAHRSENFIPNDYYATDLHRFQIVTGCNKSGKSTYIKSIALLQIMAQIGCYVPATYAGVSVIRNLFSRISTDDSIELNLSSFSLEMREMAYIQRNIDDQSLAVIDELGRGTSTRDGLCIALAMTKALIRSGAKVFFATHFDEIASAFQNRPGVLNSHLSTETTQAVDDEHPRLVMLYKIEEGPVEDEAYGIKLARAVGFPPGMMDNAERFHAILKANAQTQARSPMEDKVEDRRRLLLQLRERLKQAYESKMNEKELTDYLCKLQIDFARDISETYDEDGTEDTAAEEDSRPSPVTPNQPMGSARSTSTDSITLPRSSPLGSRAQSSLASSTRARLERAGLSSRATSSTMSRRG